MTTTELTFEEIKDKNVCKITEYNKGDVIHIEFEDKAFVDVSVSVPDNKPTLADTIGTNYGKTVIFSIDIPEGLEILLETVSNVVNAILVQE